MNELIPLEFHLSQNYPNPFNSRTRIEFSLPSYSMLSIEIFNILGQKVSVIADGYFPAGEHVAIWDGNLVDGQKAPSGIYFYKLQTNEFKEVKKMLLLK